MEIDFKVQIDPDELRHILHASAAFATASACSIFLIGLYLRELWPLIAIAGAPIIWRCFSTYRSLRQQMSHPDVFRLEDRSLLYLKNGKKTVRIPLIAIAQVHYQEGVGFSLRRKGRIEILDPTFRISSLKKKRCDLFFAWFSPSVKARLDNIVHSNQS
jgi:hypothetical protein